MEQKSGFQSLKNKSLEQFFLSSLLLGKVMCFSEGLPIGILEEFPVHLLLWDQECRNSDDFSSTDFFCCQKKQIHILHLKTNKQVENGKGRP